MSVAEYAAAFQEWARNPDAALWDSTAGDGLDSEVSESRAVGTARLRSPVMASIEERVDKIEQELQENRHIMEGRLGALSLGIHEVGASVHALRDETREGFAEVDQRFVQVDQRFDRIETTLAEILRRLPPAE